MSSRQNNGQTSNEEEERKRRQREATQKFRNKERVELEAIRRDKKLFATEHSRHTAENEQLKKELGWM